MTELSALITGQRSGAAAQSTRHWRQVSMCNEASQPTHWQQWHLAACLSQQEISQESNADMSRTPRPIYQTLDPSSPLDDAAKVRESGKSENTQDPKAQYRIIWEHSWLILAFKAFFWNS